MRSRLTRHAMLAMLVLLVACGGDDRRRGVEGDGGGGGTADGGTSDGGTSDGGSTTMRESEQGLLIVANGVTGVCENNFGYDVRPQLRIDGEPPDFNDVIYQMNHYTFDPGTYALSLGEGLAGCPDEFWSQTTFFDTDTRLLVMATGEGGDFVDPTAEVVDLAGLWNGTNGELIFVNLLLEGGVDVSVEGGATGSASFAEPLVLSIPPDTQVPVTATDPATGDSWTQDSLLIDEPDLVIGFRGCVLRPVEGDVPELNCVGGATYR